MSNATVAKEVLESFVKGVNDKVFNNARCRLVPGFVIDGTAQFRVRVGDCTLFKAWIPSHGFPVTVRFNTGRSERARDREALIQLLRDGIRTDMRPLMQGLRIISGGTENADGQD